jgi:hypothetical protein
MTAFKATDIKKSCRLWEEKEQELEYKLQMKHILTPL